MVVAYSHITREDRKGDYDDEKKHRKTDKKNLERDLVGRLLPIRALDHVDHIVKKGLPRIHRDPERPNFPRENPGPARDPAPVPAGLAYHRRRFPGYRRFVDQGRPLDDIAVPGDDVPLTRPE